MLILMLMWNLEHFIHSTPHEAAGNHWVMATMCLVFFMRDLLEFTQILCSSPLNRVYSLEHNNINKKNIAESTKKNP